MLIVLKRKLTQAYLSPARLRWERRGRRLARRLSDKPVTAELFYRSDDPHSHLLLAIAPLLITGFGLPIVLRVVGHDQSTADDGRRQRTLWQHNDAARFATAMGLGTLSPASPRLIGGLETALTKAWRLNTDIDQCVELSSHFWQGREDHLMSTLNRLKPNDTNHAVIQLRKNNERLEETGHYDAGMLYFDGECYRGVERLRHLTTRLRREGQVDGDPGKRQQLAEKLDAIECRPANLHLPSGVQTNATCEWFFSFRSPYSWLAFDRTKRLVDGSGLRLKLRPLRPMIERGVPLSDQKRRYTVTDAAREARRYGVPFGNIVDPLGVGVAHCLNGFFYAEECGAEQQFTRAALKAIWADGKNLADQKVFAKVLSDVGLSISGATKGDDATTDTATLGNSDTLAALGLWGVPTLSVDGLAVWGQDRLWQCAVGKE